MKTESAVLFVVLVGITLGITYWAGKRNKSVESHLVAKGAISGRANGVAIAGDFISAATFLGTTGAIALGGFNGFYLAVYIPIAYLLCMLLVAEPLRNLGKFTLGDVLASRFPSNSVRGVIAVSSIVVSLLYIVAQFVGAALLIQLLFGIPYWVAAAAIGVLTLVYTLFGGMLATTYIQIVKTAILLFCGALLLVLVLSKFGWSPINVFQRAAEALPNNKAILPTRAGTVAQWEQFSLIFGVTLGVLGLPHVMIRFLTVKSGGEARTSAVSAIWIFAVFLITLPVISYGAMLLVGQKEISAKSKGGNLAVPQLSNLLGGDLLLSFVSAVAFATILAALSGLVIATTGSVSHDIYAKLLMKGDVEHHAQLRIARLATVLSVAIPMLIALAAEKQNVAFLATLAIAVAASSNLPALLFTIYWRRATGTGVAVGMVAGLVTAVAIILMSPAFQSPDTALIKLSSPGIISIPVGFIVMWLVSLATQPKGAELEQADAMFHRTHTQAVTGFDPQSLQPTAEEAHAAARRA